MDDNQNPASPPPQQPAAESPPAEEVAAFDEQPFEEFPERLNCPQCKRPYRVDALKTRVNTLLTEMQLLCPRCRRWLREMRLKDWYDHYVQGQKLDPVHDDQTFAPKTLSMPNLRPNPRQPSGSRPPDNNNRRPTNRRRRHGRRQRRS